MKKLVLLSLLLTCSYLALYAEEPVEPKKTFLSIANQSGEEIDVLLQEWHPRNASTIYKTRTIKKLHLNIDQTVTLPLNSKLHLDPECDPNSDSHLVLRGKESANKKGGYEYHGEKWINLSETPHPKVVVIYSQIMDFEGFIEVPPHLFFDRLN